MQKHIPYSNKEKLTAWRKIALSSWKPKGDSAVYAFEDMLIDDTLEFCNNQKIHVNTIIIKALSIALLENPRVNSTIRFGKIYNRKDNGIFVHVLPDKTRDDLAGYTIVNAHQMSLENIDNESNNAIQAIQQQQDPFSHSKKTFNALPTIGVRWLMHTLSFILFKLNLYHRLFKVPVNPFGSIMLTSIGSLGMQQALCPIAPYTNNSMVISIEKIRKKPVVLQDEIHIKQICTFGFTFDHRLIDGIQFKLFLNSFTNALHQIILT